MLRDEILRERGNSGRASSLAFRTHLKVQCPGPIQSLNCISTHLIPIPRAATAVRPLSRTSIGEAKAEQASGPRKRLQTLHPLRNKAQKIHRSHPSHRKLTTAPSMACTTSPKTNKTAQTYTQSLKLRSFLLFEVRNSQHIVLLRLLPQPKP